MESITPASLAKSKLATQYIFLICGLGISSWATMVPFAKERLALNDGSLGLLLLLLGAGAITMMPIGSIFIQRYGSRIIVLISAILLSVTLPLLMIINNIAGMGVVLFLFGAGIGTIDVAMNAHAVHVQNQFQKPIMSYIHGLFSVGGLLGSIGLGFLIQLGLSPITAAVSIAVLLLLIVFGQYKYLLDGKTEKSISHSHVDGNSTTPKGSYTWLRKTVIYLGVLGFVVFLAEGAMLDWSAVFLRENRGVPIAWAGIGYAAFSIAMAVMRLVGDSIVSRIDGKKVVVYGSLLGTFGLFLTVLTPWLITALAGFIFLGIGAANIVPIFFSEGGRIKNVPAAIAIPAITTFGYAGQLAGPALLGFIAKHYSLPIAIGFTACLMLLVAVVYFFKPVKV